MYKTKLVGETEVQPIPNNNIESLKNVTMAVPLKHPSNIWRSLEMPLINT